MMPYDIRKPLIQGSYKEQLEAVKESLYRLIDEVNIALNTIEASVETIKKENEDGR